MPSKKSFKLPESIRVDSVKTLWTEVKKLKKTWVLNFSNLTDFDGSGFQLLAFIMNLPKENVILEALSDEIKYKIEDYGIKLENEENL